MYFIYIILFSCQTLGGKYFYYLHCTDGESEAEQSSLTWLRSPSWSWTQFLRLQAGILTASKHSRLGACLKT